MLSLEQVVSKYQDEQENPPLLYHDCDLVSSRERLVLSEESGIQRYLCAGSTGLFSPETSSHPPRYPPCPVKSKAKHGRGSREEQGKAWATHSSPSPPIVLLISDF